MVSDKIVKDITSFKSSHLVMHVKYEWSAYTIILIYVDLSLHYDFFIFIA